MKKALFTRTELFVFPSGPGRMLPILEMTAQLPANIGIVILSERGPKRLFSLGGGESKNLRFTVSASGEQ